MISATRTRTLAHSERLKDSIARLASTVTADAAEDDTTAKRARVRSAHSSAGAKANATDAPTTASYNSDCREGAKANTTNAPTHLEATSRSAPDELEQQPSSEEPPIGITPRPCSGGDCEVPLPEPVVLQLGDSVTCLQAPSTSLECQAGLLR